MACKSKGNADIMDIDDGYHARGEEKETRAENEDNNNLVTKEMKSVPTPNEDQEMKGAVSIEEDCIESTQGDQPWIIHQSHQLVTT